MFSINSKEPMLPTRQRSRRFSSAEEINARRRKKNLNSILYAVIPGILFLGIIFVVFRSGDSKVNDSNTLVKDSITDSARFMQQEVELVAAMKTTTPTTTKTAIGEDSTATTLEIKNNMASSAATNGDPTTTTRSYPTPNVDPRKKHPPADPKTKEHLELLRNHLKEELNRRKIQGKLLGKIKQVHDNARTDWLKTKNKVEADELNETQDIVSDILQIVDMEIENVEEGRPASEGLDDDNATTEKQHHRRNFLNSKKI
eukprot:g1855.t1